MRFLSYVFVLMLLVVLQTCAIASLPAIFRFYDLLVPFAVYLAIYKPLRVGLPILLAAGMIMDMMSAAPIGIYLTTYLWLFLALRQIPRWVRIRHHMLFILLSMLGVGFQNIVFGVAVLSISRTPFFTAHTMRVIVVQLFWSFVTAPFLWLGFQYLFGGSNGNPAAVENNEQRADTGLFA